MDATQENVTAAAEALKVKVNPEGFTMGDLEDFEDYVGKPLAEAVRKYVVKDEDTGKPVVDPATGKPEMEMRLSARAMTGLLWIALRSENPAFTVEDARKVRPSQVEWNENEANPGK